MANFQSAMSKQDNWNLLVTKHLLMIQVISCNQLVWLNDCTGMVVPSQMTISLSIWHFLASLPKSWLVVTVLVNIITWIRIVICHWQIFIYTQLTSCPFGNQLEDIFLSFEGAAVVNGQWLNIQHGFESLSSAKIAPMHQRSPDLHAGISRPL